MNNGNSGKIFLIQTQVQNGLKRPLKTETCAQLEKMSLPAISIFSKLLQKPGADEPGLHPAFEGQNKNISDFLSDYAIWIRGVDDGKLQRIDQSMEKLESKRWLGFFRYGVVPLVGSNPDMDEGRIGERLDFVITKLQEPHLFLPIEVLQDLTIASLGSCASTKSLIKKSFENGSLIRTTLRVGLDEKTVFIKGVWDDAGNFPWFTYPITYDPVANVRYEMTIEKGKPCLNHAYRFSHADLQGILLPYV
ncbi:Uncharacterised protein [uncultured archaeon]|nr:Uncharacterised protein [uncultured archaeon]